MSFNIVVYDVNIYIYIYIYIYLYLHCPHVFMVLWLINYMDKFIIYNSGLQDCLTSVEPLGLNLKFCGAPVRYQCTFWEQK